jgi:hypothetical protein
VCSFINHRHSSTARNTSIKAPSFMSNDFANNNFNYSRKELRPSVSDSSQPKKSHKEFLESSCDIGARDLWQRLALQGGLGASKATGLRIHRGTPRAQASSTRLSKGQTTCSHGSKKRQTGVCFWMRGGQNGNRR